MTEKKTNRKKTIEHRYLIQLKISLLLIILYGSWTAFVAMSIYYLKMGYRWSVLSIDEWMYIGCFMIGFFIVIELIIYFNYRSQKKTTKWKEEKISTQFFKGKQLYVYTYPLQAKGGIFSKTYIPLSDHMVLQIRTQMSPAEQMWPMKKEK
ncbi:MAG: hypothetical protein NT038_02575 [Euryarchaeota archaeon]|nr:hypothetical protein [Euryarchaeota archaeon]